MTDPQAPDLLILGNINLDLVLGPLDTWPARGTEALVAGQQWRVGGNAGNAVVAAAALGTRFTAISTVGDDFAGQWLRGQLGPQVRWLPSTAATSVSVAVTHSDGERTFISDLGHLGSLSRRQLGPLPSARFTLLAGGFLTPGLRREYPALLAEQSAQGSRVALDMGWPDGGFTPALRQEVYGWLPHTHFLLINELEARGLSGQTDLKAAAAELTGWLPPGGVLAVKCGASGAAIFQGSQSFSVPAPPVTVLDTVGAGDSWNTGFLHALAGGYSLEQAATFAVQVASAVVATPREQLPARLRERLTLPSGQP